MKLLKKIFIIAILGVMLYSINNNYNNAVNKCVEGGNSRQFCEIELSK
jgi:hypothetical protein